MKNALLIAFLIITLAACTPTQPNTTDVQNTAIAIVQTGIALTQTALPTATHPPPTLTPTATIVYPTPSLLPTQPIIPMITPDAIQLERWKEYQTELAKSLLSFLPSEIVLCEWEILGRTEQEVYVWATCGGGGSGAEAPVVIYLEEDETIQNVKVAGFSSGYLYDIHRLFPPDVQEKILSDLINYRRLSEHLDWRQEHPDELPLIVLSATPVP